MADQVASHYSENLALADVIAQSLRNAGKDLNKLTTTILRLLTNFIYAAAKRHWKWPGK